MPGGENDVVTYIAFPPEHSTGICSTKLLRWLNQWIERRTNVVGVLADAHAPLQLAGLVLIKVHEKWQGGRRCRGLASMCTLY